MGERTRGPKTSGVVMEGDGGGERGCWEVTAQCNYDFRGTDLVTSLPQHREGALPLHPRLGYYQMGAPEGNRGERADACRGEISSTSRRH